jgi:hypothetical protein
MMFSSDALNDKLFDFAKALLVVSFGYGLITFYETPIPGIGVSFSNLITDQAYYFQSVLEARAFDNIYQHFDELSDHFLQPDAWSILANLIYWTVLVLIALAKALSLAVIAFGLIASAVCGCSARSSYRSSSSRSSIGCSGAGSSRSSSTRSSPSSRLRF